MLNFLTMLYLLACLLVVLSLRTFFAHLQSWQIREYRWDRMRAYLRTEDGRRNLWNLWFFRGLLPRPRFSGRIFMIMGIFIFLEMMLIWGALWIFSVETNSALSFSVESLLFFLFIHERLIWFITFLAVKISEIPTRMARKILFYQAKKIRDKGDQNIISIAITGSYGKSSTKQLLVHLLRQEFGRENVLFNPENNNTEIAIARLIRKNKAFFEYTGSADDRPLSQKKFLVIEIGAYKKGEIDTACQFVQPQISLITGLAPQHLDLFGSETNLEKAKLEIAVNASEKVFYNQHSAWLCGAMDRHLSNIQTAPQWLRSQKKIFKEVIPASVKMQLGKIDHNFDYSDFVFLGQNFRLPWPGAHFVENALLALLVGQSVGISAENMSRYLSCLRPLSKALSLKKLGEATLVSDLYSSNPRGVLAAISHLEKFSGKKYILMNPLLELGEKSEEVHREIFERMASVPRLYFYTFKDDYTTMARDILGDSFCKNPSLETLQEIRQNLEEGDVVLLEGRLASPIVQIFE